MNPKSTVRFKPSIAFIFISSVLFLVGCSQSPTPTLTEGQPTSFYLGLSDVSSDVSLLDVKLEPESDSNVIAKQEGNSSGTPIIRSASIRPQTLMRSVSVGGRSEEQMQVLEFKSTALGTYQATIEYHD